MRSLLVLLVSGTVLWAAPVPKSKVPPDHTIIQGNWAVDGSDTRSSKTYWEFNEDRFVSHNGSANRTALTASKWAYKIDPTKMPKEIQLEMIGDTSTIYLGLYEIDGEKLKIIYRRGERPTNFDDTANGSTTMRFTKAVHPK